MASIDITALFTTNFASKDLNQATSNMSSSSFDQNNLSTVDNFSGGNPSDLDLIPAIIFTVVTALTLPLLAWRILSRKHRSRILINQVLFFLTRLAALIMRAYMSRKPYGLNLLIAELLLTSISALFLVNSLIDLWQKSCEHSDDRAVVDVHDDRTVVANRGERKWVKYVAHFLRLVLLASLAALIAAGAVLSRKADQEDVRNTIRNLLKASYILGLATTAAGLLAAVVTHFTQRRSWRKTLLLCAYAIPLLVSSIYRVVESFTSYRATSRQVAAFWVCMILFDLIAYSILLAISIPKWFGQLKNHFSHHDAEKANANRLASTDQTRYSTEQPRY